MEMRGHSLIIAALLVFACAGTCAARIITPAVVDVSSQSPAGLPRAAASVVDASGLVGDGSAGSTHSSHGESTMWTSAGTISGGDFDPYITFDLGGAFDIAAMRVWNWNYAGFTQMDVARMEVFAGASVDDMASVGEFELAEASGLDSYTGDEFPVGLKHVRYIKFDILTSHDGAVFGPDEKGEHGGADGRSLTGLSEVRFEGVAVGAHSPQPAIGADAVPVGTALSWAQPEAGTASGYQIYLSPDPQRVASGDPSVEVSGADADGDSADTHYALAAPIEDATHYCWRVDAIVDGETVPGPVWSFRTELLVGDLGFDEIVFVKRKPYSSDHNYSVVNNGTSPDRFVAENGIYIYNLHSAQVRRVITATDLPGGAGVIGKFGLSFDAEKAVFDYRESPSSGFRIWEVNLDGSGLRQLTFPPADETEKVARWGFAGFHTDDMHVR